MVKEKLITKGKISFNNVIFGIWKHLKRKRKWQLLFLGILILFSGLTEVFTLASIFPLLSVLTNPEKFESIELVRNLMGKFKIYNLDRILLITSVIFLVFVLFSTMIRLTNLWFCSKLSASIGTDFSCEAYRKILYQPYAQHLQRNSAVVISTCISEIDQTVAVINIILQLISALIICVSLLVGVIYVNWKIAISTGVILALSYMILALKIKNILKENSSIISNSIEKQVKSLNEGIGSIREVLLNGSQLMYLKIYKKADIPLRQLQAKNRFFAGFPRYILESISIFLIIVLVIIIKNQTDDISFILPVLGLIAFGAQKLLPAMQIVYASWASIQAKSASVHRTLNMLNLDIDARLIQNSFKRFNFKNKIEFNNISFKYQENSEYVLKNINLEIKKGEMIGIIGTTGSGKTTLINILMGLLEPTVGKVLIDNNILYGSSTLDILQAWRLNISHVPQDINLSDNSFIENIAFGIPYNEIDVGLARDSAKKAKIHNFILDSINGYKTHVGERGIKLSGGQKQRLAIARAFYKKSEILILDEATSALDNYTENLVMDQINSVKNDFTVIIIAHRLSTIEKCNRVINLKEGLIV